jgi:hypothetical protein
LGFCPEGDMAFSRMVHLLFKGESRQVFDFEIAMQKAIISLGRPSKYGIINSYPT